MTDTQKKVKIGKDKQDTLPKGAIPAYEAEDGSLHREEIDRDICNARIEYGLAMKAAGELMANNAPYVDDWECRAAAEPAEYESLLEGLLSSSIYTRLSLARKRLNQLLEEKDD